MISEQQKQQLTAAIIKNPRLLCEEVLGQNVHTGTLTMPLVYPDSEKGKTVTIPFLMTSDFSFGLGNKWTSLVPHGDIGTSFGRNLTTWYNALTSMGGVDENSRTNSQISFQSKLLETMNYQNSEKPKFQVTMMFVCTQRSYNPSEIIKTLASMALPLKFNMSKAQTLSSTIDGTVLAITDIAQLLVSGAQDTFSIGKDAVTGIQNATENAVDKTKETATNIGNTVITSDGKTVSTVVQETGKALSETASNITQGVNKTLDNTGVKQSVKNMGAKAKESIENGVQSASEGLAKTGQYLNEKTQDTQAAASKLWSDTSKMFLENMDTLKELGTKSVDALNESVMMAPLYYEAVYDTTTHSVVGKHGTMTLQIGSWFRASNLVCTNISGIKFSKETIAPKPEWLGQASGNNVYVPSEDNDNWGFPLYAECTVSLEPCTIINYDDFCSYFIQSAKGNTIEGSQLLNYALNRGMNIPNNITFRS